MVETDTFQPTVIQVGIFYNIQCACTLFCKHEIFLRTGNKFGACGDNWAAHAVTRRPEE